MAYSISQHKRMVHLLGQSERLTLMVLNQLAKEIDIDWIYQPTFTGFRSAAAKKIA